MILVVGATGNLGGAITRALLARGRAVRVLTRGGPSSEALARAGAHVVPGDLKEAASLRAACRGAEVVVTTANSALRGGEDTPRSVDWEGTRDLVDAAREAGVERFVHMSALAAGASSPDPLLAAKGRAEEHLRASGVPFTILAPNVFMDVWCSLLVGVPAREGRAVTLVGEGRRRHSFIAVADVLAFTLAAIDHPAALNQRLALGGPQAVTWLDVVAAYERALGKPLDVRHVAPGEPLPALPPAVSSLAAALDSFDSPVEMAATAQTFGVALTTLEEFVRRSAA